MHSYPTIDLSATGKNIARLRRERGLSVRELQAFFGFEDPQAIYRWQWGKSLPSVDNLYALSVLLDVPMNEILVPAGAAFQLTASEQQASVCCSVRFWEMDALAAPKSVPRFGHFARFGHRMGNFPDRACKAVLQRKTMFSILGQTPVFLLAEA